MCYQAFVTCSRSLHPIGQVPAITSTASRLSRAINKSKTLNSIIGCFVDLFGGSFQWIKLYVLRELFAIAGRTSIICQHDNVSGRGQQMIVPAISPIIRSEERRVGKE